MTTYIAHFTAKHRLIPTEQNSVFIWQQESGEVDKTLLADKIKRESSVHFFNLTAGENRDVKEKDIAITVHKSFPFSG